MLISQHQKVCVCVCVCVSVFFCFITRVKQFSECVHLQAVCFLPKDMCDVRKVEIARAVRLCKATVEPIFFKVPRTRVS